MPIDILFVNPVFLSHNVAERELSSPYFPLGLLYLAAYVRAHDFTVGVFDGTFLQGTGDFEAVLLEKQPRVVGVSALQPNRELALELGRVAQNAGARVIFGGPDATAEPESYLADPAVDYIVHHEGELTLVELLGAIFAGRENAGDLAALEGIAFRGAAGEIVVTPRRPYILDLDELPFPARELIDMQAYLDFWQAHNGYASLTISVARGCPYNCRWCQDAVHGPELRLRSPGSVVAEVRALKARYKIDRLRVVDDVDGLELARRDYRVTGIDPSEAMVAAARQRAVGVKPPPEFICVGGEAFTTGKKYHLAICLFTTLGQIEAQGDNRGLLSNVYRVLKTGGVFIVETPPRAWVAANLKAADRFGDQHTFTEVHRTFDPRANVVDETFTLVSPQGTRAYLLRYTVFTPEEMQALLENAGFQVAGLYGGYQGEPFDQHSAQMIFVARRVE